jgi:hypothetical protein
MMRATPESKRREPLHIEHKMGFAPVIRCVCGASIDTGKAKQRVLQAFCLAHEECRQASADIGRVSAVHITRPARGAP